MMDDGFVYCRRRTPAGVKIEEVSGGEGCSGAVWRAMAWQVYKENVTDTVRYCILTTVLPCCMTKSAASRPRIP